MHLKWCMGYVVSIVPVVSYSIYSSYSFGLFAHHHGYLMAAGGVADDVALDGRAVNLDACHSSAHALRVAHADAVLRVAELAFH